MNGHQALANALVAEGVRHIFAVPGSDNMVWLTELMQRKTVQLIRARKESGAAGMAEGYAKVTGTPGVCTVTIGPGLSNTSTAIVTASKHGSPVLCIVTEPPVFERQYWKSFDQQRFAETVGARYMSVRHPETLAADIQYAFRYVRSGQGTVILAVPCEVLSDELEMDWEYVPSVAVTPSRQRRHPEPELIARAAQVLRLAERPAIIVGRGAVESEAEEEIRTLAQRTGALLANTLLGRPYLTDHPYHVGIAGGFASDLGHSLLSEADCVVAVGCSLNKYTTEEGLLFAEAQIIHIDHSPAAIGNFTPVALGIIADARAALAALNKELERQGYAKKPGFWNGDVKSRIADSRLSAQTRYVEAPDSVDPRQFLAGIDEILPQNRLVVTDSGHFVAFVDFDGRISVPHPSQLIRTMDFASIGMGLYQGIGAAIGRPDRHVVVFVGDGGFMMSLEELDTAVRYCIPMTVVVMNDGAFGAEVHFLAAMGKPTDVALYENPDFVRVAEALGAEGLRVRNMEDLQAVAARIGKGDRPLLVDAKINLAAHDVMVQIRRGELIGSHH